MNPDHIQDLHWKLANVYHTTSIGCITTLSMPILVEALCDTTRKTSDHWCRTNLDTMTLTTQSKRDPTICSIIPIIQF